MNLRSLSSLTNLSSSSGVPVFELVFNYDDECFWGIPDSLIIEPQQLEINEIRTQIMKHRRQTLVKLLYQQGNIEPQDLQKMVSQDVMSAIPVKELPGVMPLKASTIPPELTQVESLRPS